MRRIVKIAFSLMLITCLLLSGCTENVVIDVYKITNNTLIVEQIKVEDRTPQTILSQMQQAGIISSDVSVESFESTGDDTSRKLIINLLVKEQSDANKIVKPFYWKNPLYRWVSFRDLRGLPKNILSEDIVHTYSFEETMLAITIFFATFL